MLWSIFESIGRLFVKEKSGPVARQPVAEQPVAVPADPELLAELKSPNGWGHRYACTECKRHYDIMRWSDPCEGCGGYISPHQYTYKWVKSLSKWLPRDQVLKMIEKLEKGEPFCRPNALE